MRVFVSVCHNKVASDEWEMLKQSTQRAIKLAHKSSTIDYYIIISYFETKVNQICPFLNNIFKICKNLKYFWRILEEYGVFEPILWWFSEEFGGFNKRNAIHSKIVE